MLIMNKSYRNMKTRFAVASLTASLGCLFVSSQANAQAASRDDIVLKFSNDAVVIVKVNDAPFGGSILGGSATLTKENRDCIPTSTTTCNYVTNSFILQSSGFDFDDEGDPGTVRNLTLGQLDPNAVFDDGTGILIPSGFPAFTAFDFDFFGHSGRNIKREPSPTGVGIILDESGHTATFSATFSAPIEGISLE